MENPQEQQRVVGPHHLPPTNVVPGQYYVSAPVTPPRPSGWVVFRRMLRLLLRRLIYLLAIILRPLRPVAGFVVVILALLGVIGWLSYQLWWPKPGEVRDLRVKAVQPSLAVENYIKGQQTYNASLMWEALSNDYQAAQLQRGVSKENLQAKADNEKLQGLRYNKYDYIGGIDLEDGGKMYFYAVDLEYQNQHAKLPMTFTVDADGKVMRILSPLEGN